MNNIVALYSSAPQSGKSTVASELNRKGWAVEKFAAPLKATLRALLDASGINPDDLLDGPAKDWPLGGAFGSKTPRDLMKSLGTEWGRGMVSQNLWTDMMKDRCQEALTWAAGLVCDDMRFPNEYEAMKDLGATMVRIIRPGLPIPDGHSSEGQLDHHHFDLTLVNDSDLSSFRDRVSNTF